jgi:hypothetical protein
MYFENVKVTLNTFTPYGKISSSLKHFYLCGVSLEHTYGINGEITVNQL